MSRTHKIAIAATVVLLLLLIPIPYQASPEWSVTVVDETGHPLQGMLVRLDYENYSVENASHDLDLYTDANGRVIFPAHKEAATTLSRLFYTARSASALAHASFGPTAFVLVFGNGREGSVNSDDGTVYFWKGKPRDLASTLIARPRDP